jgi:hypothetical protein
MGISISGPQGVPRGRVAGFDFKMYDRPSLLTYSLFTRGCPSLINFLLGSQGGLLLHSDLKCVKTFSVLFLLIIYSQPRLTRRMISLCSRSPKQSIRGMIQLIALYSMIIT